MSNLARVKEIVPDHYAISIYVPESNFRFNRFLIKDDEPLLFHTGINQPYSQRDQSQKHVFHSRRSREAQRGGANFQG